MRNLISGDWHLGRNRPGGEEETDRVLTFILSTAKERGVGRVIHLGDVFHTPNPPSEEHARVIEFAHDIADDVQIDFLVLEGNHDCNRLGESALRPVKAAADGRYLTDGVSFFDGASVFVPHQREWVAEELARWQGKTVFSHAQVDGAEVGSEGYILGASPLNLSKVTGVKRLVLGHIHKPQEFLMTNGVRVIYVGSPWCIDYGEKDEEKRILLWDDEADVFESIPTPHNRWIELNWKADSIVLEEEVEGCVVKANILSASVGFDTKGVREMLEKEGAFVHSVNVYRDEKPVVTRMDGMKKNPTMAEAFSVYVDGLKEADGWGQVRKEQLRRMGEAIIAKVTGR